MKIFGSFLQRRWVLRKTTGETFRNSKIFCNSHTRLLRIKFLSMVEGEGGRSAKPSTIRRSAHFRFPTRWYESDLDSNICAYVLSGPTFWKRWRPKEVPLEKRFFFGFGGHRNSLGEGWNISNTPLTF